MNYSATENNGEFEGSLFRAGWLYDHVLDVVCWLDVRAMQRKQLKRKLFFLVSRKMGFAENVHRRHVTKRSTKSLLTANGEHRNPDKKGEKRKVQDARKTTREGKKRSIKEMECIYESLGIGYQQEEEREGSERRSGGGDEEEKAKGIIVDRSSRFAYR